MSRSITSHLLDPSSLTQKFSTLASQLCPRRRENGSQGDTLAIRRQKNMAASHIQQKLTNEEIDAILEYAEGVAAVWR